MNDARADELADRNNTVRSTMLRDRVCKEEAGDFVMFLTEVDETFA